MGWNTIQSDLESIKAGTRFYFVHKYFASVNENTIATTNHGATFTAIVKKANFFGAQFHPEKSGRAGSDFLNLFLQGDL